MWIFVVQLLSCIQLFVTSWAAALQSSLSFTISWSLLKLMFMESLMPPNHLIPCHPLLLPSFWMWIRWCHIVNVLVKLNVFIDSMHLD